MQLKNGLVAAAFLGLTVVVAQVSAQGTPPTPAPTAPAPAGRAGGQGRPGGGGRGPATFPAQQRPPGDPAVVARGKTLYEINCQSCHAADLRGATGPSLLRSQILLSDQAGELLEPVVHGSLTRMPGINLNADDVKTLAVYIHSVLGTERTQGAPPQAGVPVTNILIGDAAAGKVYFEAKCSTCHSATGDLQGVGGRQPTPIALQNFWVSGGAVGGGGGRRGRGGAPAADPRTPTVTVTMPSGQKVQGSLVKIDDFLVTIALADGTTQSITRNGDTPKVEVKDPLAGHRALWTALTEKDVHDVTAYLVTLK